MLPPHEQPLHREDRATARRLFDERAYLEARGHYKQMRRQATARRLWAALTGAPWALPRLADLGCRGARAARRLPEVQYVPLAAIMGTDNRAHDFDCFFAPTHDHMCERWIGVAVARAQGRPLPPVELVLAADGYYVVDGHHRVSVARAYGEREIEAYVVAYADEAAAIAPMLAPA